ncbi:MAG: DUF4177 domain-containing protein [Pseudomonadota bacterium]
MPGFEYKIVPAPDRAKKIKGAKGAEARFAATLEEALNTLGQDGWEFVRTEIFQIEERTGLTGKKQIDRQVMVFRREDNIVEPARVEPSVEPVPTPQENEAVEEPPVFSSESRGPRILGRPIPPMSRPADTASDAD